MKQRLFNTASSLLKVIRNQAKILPQALLYRHMQGLLSERDILLRSASIFGTPQYFFDEPALSTRAEKFRKTVSRDFDRFRVFYAVKSNPFSGICSRVVEDGLGLDVSSGFELSLALSLNCPDIIFSGPGKTDEELRLALRNRTKVTVLLDSARELERISRLLKGTEKIRETIRVGIRIRGTHHGAWNKFGVPLKALGPLLRRAFSSSGVELGGFQFHTSWNRNPGPQIEMIKAIGAYMKKEIPKENWGSLTFIDIGGGYWPEWGEWLNPQNTFRGKLLQTFHPHYPFKPRHYFLDAKPLDHFTREISRAIALQGKPMSDLEVWMEPGRWISTPAMHILLRVIDKKEEKMVITDGGINLLGWERPLSEFIPVINLTRPSLTEIPMRIFGSLCTPLDVWGTSLFGEGVSEGDILMIPDQGAYTYGLRQSFIKPKARVIRFDGTSLDEVEPEERFLISVTSP